MKFRLLKAEEEAKEKISLGKFNKKVEKEKEIKKWKKKNWVY